MTNNELIREFANSANITLKDAKLLTNIFRDVVYSHIKDDGGVKVFDGLLLSTKYVDEHMGRNPGTGEPIKIVGKYKPVAKFYKSLKDAIN